MVGSAGFRDLKWRYLYRDLPGFSRINGTLWQDVRKSMVKPCGVSWSQQNILTSRSIHEAPRSWIKDNSKPPCSPHSATHLPSYLGKTRWREWVSFIGIFYQLLGQFDLKKRHAVVKERSLIQCCSPYYFINRLYACQISSIYLRREEGANFSFTNQHHSSSSKINALKESTKIRTSR